MLDHSTQKSGSTRQYTYMYVGIYASSPVEDEYVLELGLLVVQNLLYLQREALP